MDRNCTITTTEARPENLAFLKIRYPDRDVRLLDMENPTRDGISTYDIVHCYGLLYHLSKPGEALEFLADRCGKFLLLETCVSFGDDSQVNIVSEDHTLATQSLMGIGCRPTRRYLFDKLNGLFNHVYIPVTQPNHEDFPTDWTNPAPYHQRDCRAVFIASREAMNNDHLVPELINQQIRHE